MVKGLVLNMKKIVKKIDFKTLLIIIGLVFFEAIIFFLTKPFIQNPYVLGSSIDNKIPFISHFIWIYVFWYFMLIAVPYYIAKKDISSFYKYVITFVITTLIAGIIFVVFPNTVIRANIESQDISSKLVKLIYSLDDPGINCLPSIHCLYSFLFIFAILNTKNKSSLISKILVIILSILVVLSTLFIKQHVIYDALAALIICTTTWYVVSVLKLHQLLLKRDNINDNKKNTTQVA